MQVAIPTTTSEVARVAARSIPWSAALTVGLGIALPMGAQASIPASCTLGQVLTSGSSCSMDVTGEPAAEVTSIDMSATSCGPMTSWSWIAWRATSAIILR